MSDPRTADGAPLVVVVGAAARDHAADDRRGWRLGGGVTYSALTVARLGLPTGALVGVDPAAARAAELDLLRLAGADVRLVPLDHGPVFDNLETPGGRIQRCFERSDRLPVAALPGAWRTARSWILAPVAGELGDEWADAIPPEALVAVAWQGLLRELVPGERVVHHPPARSPLIERADLVGVSRDDFDANIPLEALTALMKPGATLCITQGNRGGLAVLVGDGGRVGHLRRWPAVPSAAVVDPTGAGDVFLAALLAAHAEPGLVGGRLDRGHDLLLAAAAASLVVEGPGLLAVPERDAVRRRIALGWRQPARPSRARRATDRPAAGPDPSTTNRAPGAPAADVD